MICVLSRCIPSTFYLALVLFSFCPPASVHLYTVNCTLTVCPQVPKEGNCSKHNRPVVYQSVKKSDACRTFSGNSRLLRKQGKLYIVRVKQRFAKRRFTNTGKTKKAQREKKYQGVVMYARGAEGAFVRSRVERRPRWLARWSRLRREIRGWLGSNPFHAFAVVEKSV